MQAIHITISAGVGSPGGGAAGGGGGGAAGRNGASGETNAANKAIKDFAGGMQSISSAISSPTSGLLSGLAKLGPAAAVVGGTLLLFNEGLKAATATMAIMRDTSLTKAQKNRALEEKWVPFMGTINEFEYEADGTNRRLQANQKNYAREQALQPVRHATEMQNAGVSWELNQALSAQRGVRSMAMAGYANYDPMSVAGQLAQRRQGMMLPARDANLAAERNYAGSMGSVRTAANRVENAEGKYDKIKTQLADWESRLKQIQAIEATGERRKADMDEAQRNVSLLNQRLIDAEAEKMAEINRLAQTRAEASKSATEATKTRVGIMQAELAILREQEQKAAHLRGNLGGMYAGDISYAANMLKIAKQGNNFENMPPEMHAMFEQIGAGDWVRNQREMLGEKRLGMVKGILGQKDFGEIFPDEAGGQTLEGIRRKAMAVEANMRVTLEFDTQRAAADLIKALGPKWAEYVRDAKFQLEAANRKFDSNMGIQNTQRN